MKNEKHTLSSVFPRAEVGSAIRRKAMMVAAQTDTSDMGAIIEAGIDTLFNALPDDKLESITLIGLSKKLADGIAPKDDEDDEDDEDAACERVE